MYDSKVQSESVVLEHCYFSEGTGASVIFMKGHKYHIEEDEVAKSLEKQLKQVALPPLDLSKHLEEYKQKILVKQVADYGVKRMKFNLNTYSHGRN